MGTSLLPSTLPLALPNTHSLKKTPHKTHSHPPYSPAPYSEHHHSTAPLTQPPQPFEGCCTSTPPAPRKRKAISVAAIAINQLGSPLVPHALYNDARVDCPYIPISCQLIVSQGLSRRRDLTDTHVNTGYLLDTPS